MQRVRIAPKSAVWLGEKEMKLFDVIKKHNMVLNDQLSGSEQMLATKMLNKSVLVMFKNKGKTAYGIRRGISFIVA